MGDEFRLVIGEALTESASGERMDVVDPSHGAVFAQAPMGGPEDARLAVEAARRAFDTGPWPRMSGGERAAYLRELAGLVKENAAHLAELESQDSGGTIRRCKTADIGMVITTFRLFADIAARTDEEEPLPRLPVPPSAHVLRREPIGVCVGITPWNFPMQMASWKIAPAIAAGNTVVIKPSPYASLTTLELGRLCLEAGIPPGVVNVVTGRGADVGEPLVSSPLVDKVSFTGSTEVGRRILQLSAGNMKRHTLELGGKSAAIVFDDVDLGYATDGVIWGAFFHSGQVCAAGTRLLVQRGIYGEFLAGLLDRLRDLRVGPAGDPDTDFGPLISEKQRSTVEGYVRLGLEEGARLVAGGERAAVPTHPDGYYYQPTIFEDVTSGMRIAQEEIFGPVLVVMPFDSDAEAVALANDSSYGLAGAVWSGDVARATKAAEAIRSGTVWINDHHMVHPRYPFGGYRQSGIGREHGLMGFNEYRETKHIHIDETGSRGSHRIWDVLLPPAAAGG